MTIFVYCADGTGTDPEVALLYEVRRLAPLDREPLDAALQQLFLGVTPDEADQGYRSFGPDVGAAYVGARVEDGVAIVEFTDSLPTVNNLSTANASAYFYKQLEANVFQFPEVAGLEYVVGGERWCGFENFCSEDSPYPLFTESDTTRPPSLLIADRLEGEWREVDTKGDAAPICGRDVPHPDGVVSRDRIQLLAEPDQRGLVTHELVEYESAVAAANAIAVFVEGSRCGEFTQPDGSGPATVTVSSDWVDDHLRTKAMSLLYEWADGSGQSVVKTATRHGSTVSYVDIDAVQGGSPRGGFVASILDAVEDG